MDQKIDFAMKAVNSPNFGELCREYGISRKTGYKWRERFIEGGLGGLNEVSRRPHSHADELKESVVCQIVQLKTAHPYWGPRKIQELYRRLHRGKDQPSESSFKRVLERAGLTVPRRMRRSEQSGRLASGIKAEKPNEVWTVDFKGWWKDREGLKVEPLTVRDECSRMILELRMMESARTEAVRARFEALFRNHGLPGAIRSDNGPPFGTCAGLLGLSHLSAWWLALGINLERSRPGCPQDNGAHERMHLDIQKQLQAAGIGRNQAAFDTWRHEFNTERPHESLDMRMPAEVYQPSSRTYEGTPDDLNYGVMTARKVTKVGTIGYEGVRYLISTTLRGWSVGICPQKDGREEVWFAKLLVGHLTPATGSFMPIVLPPKNRKPWVKDAGGAS